MSVCRFTFPHCMQSMAFSGDRFLSAVPGSQHSWAESGDFSCTSFPLHAPAPPIRPAAGGPCVTADELHCYVAVTQGPRLTTGSLTPGLAPSESGRVAGAWPGRRRHAAPPPPPLIPAPRDTDPSMSHGSVLSTASVGSACAAFSSGLRPRSERLFLKAWLAVRGTCESALFS